MDTVPGVSTVGCRGDLVIGVARAAAVSSGETRERGDSRAAPTTGGSLARGEASRRGRPFSAQMDLAATGHVGRRHHDPRSLAALHLASFLDHPLHGRVDRLGEDLDRLLERFSLEPRLDR